MSAELHGARVPVPNGVGAASLTAAVGETMHSYAQTNVQLFNQVVSAGYAGADLYRIRAAYDLALRTCLGRFQASGKPLLAHLLGTASILHSIQAPPKLVLAGLLHSIYYAGDFGDGRRAISRSRRREVRCAVGEEAEECVAATIRLSLMRVTTPAIREHLDDLDALSRDAVLIRLADHLEHLLDLAPLYHGDPGRMPHMNRFNPFMVDMSEKLGYPLLAAEFDRWIRELGSHRIPDELRGATGDFSLAPRSHHMRPSIRTIRALSLVRRRALSAAARLRGRRAPAVTK